MVHVEAECMESHFQGFMIIYVLEYEGVGCQNWVHLGQSPA